MRVTVKKVGSSIAVVFPLATARNMGLTVGTPLEVITSRDTIVIRPKGRRPRRSIQQIVAAIKPDTYRRRRCELENDMPLGKKIS
jgi:antitoxin component of MazEF toxin-antitoxin module